MALVLTVEHHAWWEQVRRFADRLGDRLVPVIKGNGYGLGRDELARCVAELGLPEVAVGTVHELAKAAGRLRQLVLTPALDEPLDGVPDDVVLTVGSLAQLDAARAHRGPLAYKLRSSMQRYGATPAELPELLAAGPAPDCFVLHLPLVGSDEDRRGEIEAWLPHLPADVDLSVSHLEPASFEALTRAHPGRGFRLRVGTALWHGDKRAFRLGALVTEVRPVHGGDTAGYRHVQVPDDGHLVVISAGSAHGVVPLPDGRSPFHYARQRLDMLEPPHMHSSMAVVPTGSPCPRVGELVDVQRPLTQVHPDRILWLR